MDLTHAFRCETTAPNLHGICNKHEIKWRKKNKAKKIIFIPKKIPQINIYQMMSSP